MTKEVFDAQFVTAYYQLQRTARPLAGEYSLDLVHDVYCRVVGECERLERVTPAFLWTRLRWLSYERYRQLPTYVELEDWHSVEEPVEPSLHAVVTQQAMEGWSEKDRDTAEMIAYPETRSSIFKLRPAHRRVRPLLELAFRQAGIAI